MQLPALSSVTPHLIPFSALIVALCGVYITVTTLTEHRNADLVRIGISVLRVDPDKEKQISAAREWALDLIDANAGGMKFSAEARAQLLKKRLETYGSGYPDGTYGNGGYADGTYGSGYPDSPDYAPVKPAPRRPSAEPPK